jgi:hypothetical protein
MHCIRVQPRALSSTAVPAGQAHSAGRGGGSGPQRTVTGARAPAHGRARPTLPSPRSHHTAQSAMLSQPDPAVTRPAACQAQHQSNARTSPPPSAWPIVRCSALQARSLLPALPGRPRGVGRRRSRGQQGGAGRRGGAVTGAAGSHLPQHPWPRTSSSPTASDGSGARAGSVALSDSTAVHSGPSSSAAACGCRS